MAQPVFDDHPLEEYFRQSGEVIEDMPGTHADVLAEPYHDSGAAQSGSDDALPESFQLPGFLSKGVQVLNTLLCSSPDNQFVERFKYDVISSALLSSTLSATPRSAVMPGRLPDEPGDSSRTSSTTDPTDPQNAEDRSAQLDSLQVPTALVSVAIVAVSAEYYFVALFILAFALAIHHSVKSHANRATIMSSTASALNELISAGNVWDSTMNQAMVIVEKEERSRKVHPIFPIVAQRLSSEDDDKCTVYTDFGQRYRNRLYQRSVLRGFLRCSASGPSAFYGPTSPHSPFSPLRVALQSSLHTTQNQCDNIRQLLSALTSPEQASQLSEMYAPSSPTGPSFLQLDQLHPRPMSDPVANWRKRTSSLPSESPYNKRATWNGSYVALAQASKPTSNSTRRSDRRRSDLTLLFNAPPPTKLSSMSAPPTPLPGSQLFDVQEEAEMSDEEEDAPHLPELSEQYFGMAALDLRKKRQSAGLSSLRMSGPPSYSTQTSRSPQSLTTASRFTLPQTSRNPLSLSALRLALHGALSAKRYACSHLLALRFEDEDLSYWEDVRSMMALLTTTFSDASARLTDALDDNEKKRMRDERPAPSEQSPNFEARITPSKSMQEMVGFAPMPSHLTRFATHVDAISTALDDARTHLEHCVASLRDPIKQSMSADPFLDTEIPLPPTEHPALQAYDRLRKELGFALRECERGREHLLNTIMPPSSHSSHMTDGEDEAEATPSLVPDTATSDGGASAGSLSLAVPPVLTILEPVTGLGLDVPQDDATEHLLMGTSSQHLPPPGIDQVYEADSGVVGIFTRERSKLSREDRIRMAKERRRESGGRGHLAFKGEEVQEVVHAKGQWGPGGEVVQELKDVIWKVSEKKRRLSEQVQGWQTESEEMARRHSSAGASGAALTLPQLEEDAARSADVADTNTILDVFADTEDEPTPTDSSELKADISSTMDMLRTTPVESPFFNAEAAAADTSIPDFDEDGDGGLAYLES
ncbi:hypothetical protein EIP91_005491 [Steccherinum ochraceum]|uniref:Myosin-binding domain-containing protein n=1 Tax=Steccherinum ochraceum TaxID=92696 RepID=A0A4R0RXJ6_9APHY|nr:hypothetical protein EIP91_005491 [Steccherinum ochraceum]